MLNINYFKYNTLSLVFLIVSLVLLSCNSNDATVKAPQEDAAAKKVLQGTWINEFEGNAVFSVKGDTIYYNDTLSTPASFYIANDTLFIENHSLVKYPIKSINSTNLVFINSDGDEVSLVKSSTTLSTGEYKGAVNLNQGKKVKKDTVMTYSTKRYHAYTQVNPTTYKVYRQTTNSDGLSVESVYYDNIVYLALYEGQQKIFGQNIVKSEFQSLVPKTYLDSAVLSEIVVDRVGSEGVTFVAVLTIPDSYTNYRVNILISPDGKKTLSL
ncbi:MAG: DUF4738 domain-containing protein [Prevotella sp.]|nr:DUF4738 domain-containing protein [Candidatus Prevotella equi]